MKPKLEIVHDDTLKVEELLRSNERLREEYNVLAAKHTKLIGLLQYTGKTYGGAKDTAHLTLSVPLQTFRDRGVEAAIFELLNAEISHAPKGAQLKPQ